MATTISEVKKDQLGQLSFFSKDALTTNRDKIKRQVQLDKSLSAGTSYNPSKSRIIFESKSGIKKVLGIVIAVSGEKVTLEGMNRLPLKCIISMSVIEVAPPEEDQP